MMIIIPKVQLIFHGKENFMNMMIEHWMKMIDQNSKKKISMY
jgi:hypothetical protein